MKEQKYKKILELWNNDESITVSQVAERLNISIDYVYLVLHKNKIKSRRFTALSKDIIALFENGRTAERGWQTKLAQKYGVSRQAVSRQYFRLKGKYII